MSLSGSRSHYGALVRAWWSGSLGTCPETFSVGRAALERGHQVRHVTSPWCVRGFLQFSYSSQVRSLCSSFLSKRNTTRSYSSVQTAAMATSTDSSADSKLAWRNLIQQLTPHIYIHLARSRFKDNSQLGLNPENEFRQGWAQEDDIKRLLLQIFQNYVQNGTDPLEVNAKLLIQDTVNAVNKQFQSGASNYSLDGVVEAENVRLNEKLVDEIRYQGDRSHELLREQLALETKTLDEAINKYRSISYDLQKRGKGSAMKPAERMMLSWFTPAIKAVEERLKHFEVTHHQRAPYKGAMLALGPAVLTTVALHEIVNMILNSPGGIAYTHAAKVMGKAVELEVNRHMLQQDKAVWKDVTRQCKYNNRKETVINRMAEALYERGRWDAAQTIRCGAVLLDILIETAAVPGESKQDQDGQPVMVPALTKQLTLRRKNQWSDSERNNWKSWHVLCSEKVFQTLEKNQGAAEGLFSTPKPMVCKPRPWKQKDIGGYLSVKTTILRTRSRKHLETLDHANMPLIYEGLNYLGDVAWRVNQPVLEVMDELWKRGGNIAGLVPVEDTPLPHEPQTDNEEDWKAWRRECSKVKKFNREMHSLRCDTQYKLDTAKSYPNRDIYFPVNMDFRGRVYPIPPHLNHLGSDLSRSLLVFSRGVPLGENGLKWLKVHLGNQCGKDKASFEERIQFANDNIDKVMAVCADPLGDKSDEGKWWLEAEDPFQCLATCFELGAALKSEDPTKHISHFPVHMDGSCNGLQHYGALGRDKAGGEAVNLTPADKPQDVYSGVLKIVNEKIQRDAEAGHPLAILVQGKITRKVVKQTVMTSVYGVTMIGARQQIHNRLRELQGIDWPEPEDQTMSNTALYLAQLSLSSLGDMFSSAKNIMDWFAEIAVLVGKKQEPMSWITPLGLPVVQPYTRVKDFRVYTTSHDLVISDNSDLLPVSIARQKSAFPPNFVHSLDATHMFMTALDCKNKNLDFAAVHDSYWTHAGNLDVMNASLREQFIKLYSQPILERLRESLVMRFPDVNFPPVPSRGELDLNLVRESKYFFA